MFIDEAKITIRSGHGGDGVVSFRHEKFVPRGGPDGGDGGRGGDVILVAEARVRTLLRFRHERLFSAQRGGHGQGKDMHGKNGKDIVLAVPVGTVVHEEGVDEPLVDLAIPGMSAVVARGGRGGRGNAHYVSSVRQAPRFAEKGEPGDERELVLELKVLADVGLVGLPNAGKSTLLAACSHARPKIADYPFTTVEPQLGVVAIGDNSFIMADLPGLIEGAAQGKGMGLDFLRHTERCRVLVHVLDASGGYENADPWEAFLTVNRELAEHGAGLSGLPMVVALNKTDVPEARDAAPQLQSRIAAAGFPCFPVSAVTREGLAPLLYAAEAAVREREEADPRAPAGAAPPHLYVPRARRAMEINLLDEGLWEITGSAVERLIAMTDLGSEEGVDRLQRTMERTGVFRALRERGVRDGDRVHIGGVVLTFTD